MAKTNEKLVTKGEYQTLIIINSRYQLLAHSQKQTFRFSPNALPTQHIDNPQRFQLDNSTQLVITASDITFSDELEWVGLRSLLGAISERDFQHGSQAIQRARWLTEHQYCGRCGAQTSLATDEPRLDCRQCELSFYPRISPCVIGLITRGDECLLARGQRMPEGMFSTLAGFIEVGESAEQAFEREVFEEVGVNINNIAYAGSQSWPFPGQLMLGYTADYVSGALHIDEKEIVEANWYHYKNLPLIPPESTISGQLIRRFVAAKKVQD